MFEKLFVKTSDLVFHTIAPYAVERERFLAHCGEEGFSKVALRRIAGIVVTAACDLHAHGGLEVDQKRLEAAAGRIEMTRRQAGVRDDAREYRREFLRVTTRWVLFLGRLQPQAPSTRPYAALLDDFERWMTEERGLSRGTLKGRRWHVGRFLDWLHERQASVPGLSPRDLDGYLQHLDAQRLSRVSIKIHTDAVRAFIRHAERRGWCAAGLADTLHGPHIYRDNGLPIGPSWDDVNRVIQDAASDDPTDVRDRAILLLLAVYGFRAGEVAALRLDDVDWEHDRLTVRRSKPGRSQVYPLMPVVGQAIIRYLKEARPRRACRELFLKVRAPIGPMTSKSLYSVVADRITRLGLHVQRRGPHVLRHACAGHLMARGLSLKEIADHLGHRSLTSTRVYAKVDIQGLREVAAFDLGGLA
jgi:site-specific recombinase XerD